MTVEGVVLAAGRSSRMGVNKLIQSLKGRTVIEWTLSSLMPFCSRILVVTGPEQTEYQRLFADQPKIVLIANPLPARGMFSSIKTGMMCSNAEKMLILPGDCPMISPSTCRRVLTVNDEIAVPVYQGQNGHPVMIENQVIPALFRTKAETLREFIAERGCSRIEVNDPGILLDIDTPEDLEAINRRMTAQ